MTTKILFQWKVRLDYPVNELSLLLIISRNVCFEFVCNIILNDIIVLLKVPAGIGW